MPRLGAAYRLDGRVLGAVAHGKTLGEIPIDALPLGETRGTKRKAPAEQDKGSDRP